MNLNRAEKHTCSVCGKQFLTYSTERMTCSKECKRMSKKIKLDESTTKKCVWCGKEFETKSTIKVYCSDSCRNKARYRRMNGQDVPTYQWVEDDIIKCNKDDCIHYVNYYENNCNALDDVCLGKCSFYKKCKKVFNAQIGNVESVL